MILSPARQARDAYFTPDRMAVEIVKRAHVRGLIHGHIVEPSCGGGAFLRALQDCDAEISKLTGIDLQPTDEAGACDATIMTTDWLSVEQHSLGKVDCIIGNPPFKDAEQHIRHALELAPTVIMLVRISFLASAERCVASKRYSCPLWLQYRPTWVDVVAPRPSFTGGGTDPSDYAIVTWTDRSNCVETNGVSLDWLTWSKRDKPPKRPRLTPAMVASASGGKGHRAR